MTTPLTRRGLLATATGLTNVRDGGIVKTPRGSLLATTFASLAFFKPLS